METGCVGVNGGGERRGPPSDRGVRAGPASRRSTLRYFQRDNESRRSDLMSTSASKIVRSRGKGDETHTAKRERLSGKGGGTDKLPISMKPDRWTRSCCRIRAQVGRSVLVSVRRWEQALQRSNPTFLDRSRCRNTPGMGPLHVCTRMLETILN